MVKSFLKATLCGVGLTLATAASAHHSFSMFDKSKTSVLDGTLYALQWEAPHSWIWVEGKDPSGKDQVYGFEGGSPAALTKAGYSKANLKVGSKIHVVYNPLRSGQPGGSLISMTIGQTAVGGGF
jgi:hypothetical protein